MSTTETIIEALRVLARDIQSGDGVANAAIAAAADRLEEQQERIKQMEDWIGELEVIDLHTGTHDRREWHGDIGWLRPGQIAYVGGWKP